MASVEEAKKDEFRFNGKTKKKQNDSVLSSWIMHNIVNTFPNQNYTITTIVEAIKTFYFNWY